MDVVVSPGPQGASTRELAAEYSSFCRGKTPATRERYEKDGNEAEHEAASDCGPIWWAGR